MEEIKRSLSSSSDSSSKLAAVSNLYSKILAGSEPEQEAAVRLLWSQLGSGDILTSQACADLLVVLVRAGKAGLSSSITQLLACLSQGQQYSGLVPALGQLVILQYRRQGGQQQVYSISSSQHPLLSVLRSTPATWSLVMDVMNLVLHHQDQHVRQDAVNILRPVLLYLFCDGKTEDNLLGIFNLFDEDGNGTISIDELLNMMAFFIEIGDILLELWQPLTKSPQVLMLVLLTWQP